MDRIKYKACPVCDGKKFEELRKAYVQEHVSWVKGSEAFIQWMECASCGHVFTAGYLGAETFAKMIKKVPLTQVPGWDPEKARVLASRTVELAQLLSKTPGDRWLDVGCGDGSLLGLAQECGFTVRGLDVRADTVGMLQAAGLDVDQMDFMELPERKKFDVVSMRDVLEHLPFPRLAIEKAKRLIRSNGLLIVSTPSRECLAWKLPGPSRTNPYWTELEHYHFFSAAGVYQLLENVGFSIVHVRSGETYKGCIEIYARRV